MNTDDERQERALDDLIVAALGKAAIRGDLPDLEGPEPILSKPDRIALDALGPDLVDRLLEDAAPARRIPSGTRRNAGSSRPELAGSLHRGEGEVDITDESRAEMERNVRELEAGEEEGKQP